MFVLVTASAAAAATVTVTPGDGTAAVGHPYCVTATVTGSNRPDFVVEFTAEPTSGSAATPNPPGADVPADSNGQAQFCVVAVPTDKDQCKQGGWQTFGIFKNQGDCVSFVATGGKNPSGE